MKSFKSIVTAVGLCLALSGQVMAVEAGKVAPDVDLAIGGATQKLSSFKGKVVYLDFWASWCGPCRQSFPWMNEMQSKYSSKGLQIVAVNLDAKKADADQFLANLPAKFAVAYDPKGDSAKRYEIKGMPSSVLIGADGKVIAVHQGFKDDDRAELEAKFASALAAATN
jgi:cytochrome c biogenesis protein CcmG/thiol:disulfide interchange protein DsbE